jgi:hypothetical protein
MLQQAERGEAEILLLLDVRAQHRDDRGGRVTRPAAFPDGAIEAVLHQIVLALQGFGHLEELHSRRSARLRLRES